MIRQIRGSLATKMSRDIFLSVVLIALISGFWCFGACSPSTAQESRSIDQYVWKKDKLTGSEIALSRSDGSFNFFDVGDLSYYSQSLVEQNLRIMAAAAGLTIERSPSKISTIAIVHDTNVFSRLKSDKHAFHVLGFSDNDIGILQQRSPDDAKCVSVTVSDDKNNIINTIVLLSEKSGISEHVDVCLMSALLDSFGIVGGGDINVKTLINACILYEARRRGLRDRQALSEETPRLRDLCLAKAGVAPGK